MSADRDSIQPFRNGQRSLSASHQMEPLRMAATKGSVGDGEFSDATGTARRRRGRGGSVADPEYFKIVGYAVIFIHEPYSNWTSINRDRSYIPIFAYGQPTTNKMPTTRKFDGGVFGAWAYGLESYADPSPVFYNDISLETTGTPSAGPAEEFTSFDDKVLRSDEYSDCIRIFPKTPPTDYYAGNRFISSVLPNSIVKARKMIAADRLYMDDLTDSFGSVAFTTTSDYILDSEDSSDSWRLAADSAANAYPGTVYDTSLYGTTASKATAASATVLQNGASISYPVENSQISITVTEGVVVLNSAIVATNANMPVYALTVPSIGGSSSNWGPIDGVMYPGLPGYRQITGDLKYLRYTSVFGGTTDILLALYAQTTGQCRMLMKPTANITSGSSGAGVLGFGTTGTPYWYDGGTYPSFPVTIYNTSGVTMTAATAYYGWYARDGLNVKTIAYFYYNGS